jgi:hypothetical protein
VSDSERNAITATTTVPGVGEVIGTTTTLPACLYEPAGKWQLVIEVFGWRLLFEVNLYRPWQKLLPRREE